MDLCRARHNLLACALGVTAIKAGKSVYRTTLTDLVGNLAKAQHGEQLNQKLRQLSRPALLIADRFAFPFVLRTSGKANLSKFINKDITYDGWSGSTVVNGTGN